MTRQSPPAPPLLSHHLRARPSRRSGNDSSDGLFASCGFGITWYASCSKKTPKRRIAAAEVRSACRALTRAAPVLAATVRADSGLLRRHCWAGSRWTQTLCSRCGRKFAAHASRWNSCGGFRVWLWCARHVRTASWRNGFLEGHSALHVVCLASNASGKPWPSCGAGARCRQAFQGLHQRSGKLPWLSVRASRPNSAGVFAVARHFAVPSLTPVSFPSAHAHVWLQQNRRRRPPVSPTTETGASLVTEVPPATSAGLRCGPPAKHDASCPTGVAKFPRSQQTLVPVHSIRRRCHGWDSNMAPRLLPRLLRHWKACICAGCFQSPHPDLPTSPRVGHAGSSVVVVFQLPLYSTTARAGEFIAHSVASSGTLTAHGHRALGNGWTAWLWSHPRPATGRKTLWSSAFARCSF